MNPLITNYHYFVNFNLGVVLLIFLSPILLINPETNKIDNYTIKLEIDCTLKIH